MTHTFLKGIFILSIAFSAGTGLAQNRRVPLFSPALFIGGSEDVAPARGTSATAPGAGTVRPTAQTPKQAERRTILRYAPKELKLNEEQRQQLTGVVTRLQSGNVQALKLIGISQVRGESFARLTDATHFFQGYAPEARITTQIVDGAAVFDQNDNTLEVLEIY